MVENVSFQTTDEVVGDLDDLVEDRDDFRSRSDVIRAAIQQFIENYDSDENGD